MGRQFVLRGQLKLELRRRNIRLIHAARSPSLPLQVAQKDLLGSSHLVDDLKSYDADHIDAAIIEKIAPYVAREDFSEAVVTKASVAAGGLCKWVHAIVIYDKTARIIAPKRAALATATAELEAAQSALASKQTELKTLQDKLSALEAELAAAVARKEKLAKDVQDCEARLDRAQRLIGEGYAHDSSFQNSLHI